MSGRIVAFWSPGSSGVTTVLANVAALLGQQLDLRTVAVDFNLTNPGIGLNLGLFRQHSTLALCLSHLLPVLASGSLTPEQLSRSLAAVPGAPGLQVLAGLFRPLALAQVGPEQIEQLLDSLTDQFDLVLVDLPAPIDYTTTYLTLEKSQTVVWLVSGQLSDRFHLKRYLELRPALGLADLEGLLVLNRPGPATARQVEYELNLPVRAEVPHCPALPLLIEQGIVPVLTESTGGGLAAFRTGIESVARLIAPGLRTQRNAGRSILQHGRS